MNEGAGVEEDLAVDLQMTPKVAAVAGPGALLRNARESQGLHIAALAVALKIPVKKLEALEADRYDLLPDTVFARALALSVCRFLKLDAGPVMAALPQLQTPSIKTDEVGLNASFKSADTGLRIALAMRGMNPAVFAMLALAVAIAVVFFWPASSDKESLVADADIAEPALVAGSTPVQPGALNPQGTEQRVDLVQTVQLSTMVPASAPTVSASASDTASAGGASVLASPAAPVSSSMAGSILTLQASGQSWIDVTDARGQTQLRKTLTAGETVQVAGALPLSVVLGRADVVAVLVRGKSLDVSAVAKDNVARFEVK